MNRTRAAAVIGVLLLCALAAAAPASAHSFTRATRPAPRTAVEALPKRVVIWFDEPVEATFAQIAVSDRTGRTVTRGDAFPVGEGGDALAVRLQRTAPAGRFRVEWRVVSADSHIQQGTFTFRVRGGASKAAAAEKKGAAEQKKGKGAAGDAKARAGADPALPAMPQDSPPAEDTAGAGAATAWTGAARGLTMAGVLLLLGVLAFWLLAWRGLRAAVLPRSHAVEEAFARRAGRLTVVALVLAGTGTLGWVVLHGAAAADAPVAAGMRLDVLDRVLGTGFGLAAVARIVFLELLVITALLLRLLPGRGALPQARAVGAAVLQPPLSTARCALLVAVVVPLLLTLSLVSHAATASPTWLHVGADVLHLGAAGAWLGGVVVLIAAAFPVARTLSPPERVALLGPVVVRFSRVAAICVFLVAVTGVVRAWNAVGTVANLTGTPYGRVLIAKLGLFSALLLLGAVNHLWAVKRIARAAVAGADTSAVRVLRRTVTTETVLATVVVAATAVLVSLPAPTM